MGRNNWNLDYPGKIHIGLPKFFSLLGSAHSRILKIQSQTSPFRVEGRHFPTSKDKKRVENNMPETLHCYQEKDEQDRNNFCLYHPKFLQKTQFVFLGFSTVEVKKRTEGRQGLFHLCAKSSCCTKGHWFYTLVINQVLSLFLKWFCFDGWCRAVDVYYVLTQVLYLDWYLSWVTTLTCFMTGALRTWRPVF